MSKLRGRTGLKPRVHFMGIGGSGVSAIAQLAAAAGYQVSGCDVTLNTPYLNKIKKAGIDISEGHSADHLNDVDILAVSPAAYFSKPIHPELSQAINEGKALTWQNFLGKHIQSGMEVIAVAGTHGKSTTTAMAGLMFESAGLDPSVCIGATVPEWDNNCRTGRSKQFIVEADEFYDNFLNYTPSTVILNNIEPDHPDFFKSESQLFESFANFLQKLKGPKNLIVNLDSSGVLTLLKQLPESLSPNLIGYTCARETKVATNRLYRAENISHSPAGSSFKVNDGISTSSYNLQLPGDYNISNALGVIALGQLCNVPLSKIQGSLAGFTGIGRRLELIGQPKGVLIYDDYAHHPTAVKLTLQALKQRHPSSRIYCVVEPHSFSRTKQLLNWYEDAFAAATEVIITPIFKARDQSTFEVGPESIVIASKHPDCQTLEFALIPPYLKSKVKSGDVIVVMGAGLSYQLARDVLDALER